MLAQRIVPIAALLLFPAPASHQPTLPGLNYDEEFDVLEASGP